MTGWRGILHVLPLLIAQTLPAADGLDSAARELARRIPNGLKGPVLLTVRNLSDLGAQDVASLRRVLEGELRGRVPAVLEGAAGDEIRVTLSQNLAGYLLVAEIKRGEERQVMVVPMPISSPHSIRAGSAAVVVEKVLLIQQPEPILDIAKLDIAKADADLLMLQSGRVVRLGLENGQWVTRELAAFAPISLPRDPRGKLVVQGGAYLAYLPGTICSGAVAPLDARCRDADEAWPLGHEPALRANFARGRNYFDGRVSVPGTTKSVPPFYSVAAVDEPVGRLWIFTHLDGRAYLHDSSLEALAPLGGWGSDIAAVAARCGSGSVVLTSRAAYGSEKDTIHVYQIVDRQAVERAPAIDLPGPVTALWPAGENSTIAVARDIGSGEYAAYRLAITCGH